MNITRNNYEEYFILYLDGELNSEDRRQVELFVQKNADLKEEFDWLLQSRVFPDTTIVFGDKEQLMKTSGTDSINTTNYEEWLLLYTDNELSVQQKTAVEQFIVDHPVVKAELELLQKTKLQPEKIIFTDKEILYRKAEKVRIVAIRWWRIAVAAALLLAVSSTALLVFDNSEINRGNIAAGKVENKKAIQNNPGSKKPGNKTVLTDPQIADNSKDKIEKEPIESSNPVAQKKEGIEYKIKNAPSLPFEVKQDEVVDVVNKGKKKTNDLPQPSYNPNVKVNMEQDSPIAKVDLSEKGSLTIPEETNSLLPVTPDSSPSLDNIIAATSKGFLDPIEEEQPGRKNKLRGFFRKVTRTFEKTTNIKATDDEDRLLLGGLAIKL